MVFTTTGGPGSLNATELSRLMALATVAESVETPTALKVAQVSGNRQVSVAAGAGYGPFARTVNTDLHTMTAFTAPSASAWYLIVLRRKWTTNGITATIEALAGPTVASQVVPTAYPSTLPATVKSEPGVEHDQKLAWAWVRQNSTEVILFDLRLLPWQAMAGGVVPFGELSTPAQSNIGAGSWITLGGAQPSTRELRDIEWGGASRSGALIVRTRGRYLPTAHAVFGATDDARQRFIVNGGPTFAESGTRGAPSNPPIARTGISTTLTLNVGDIVETQILTNTGGELYGNRLTLTYIGAAP